MNSPANTNNNSDKTAKSAFRLKAFLIKLGLFIIFLYLLIWIFSPIAARYFVGDWLKQEFNLDLSEDTSIRFNPFLSHLSITNLTVSNEQQVVLSIEELGIELRAHRLLAKQVYVSEFNLQGLFVIIKKNDQLLSAAGIVLSRFSELESNQIPIEENSDRIDFEIVLPKLKVVDSLLNLDLNNDLHNFKIKSFNLKDVLISSEQQTFNAELIAFIDASSVELISNLNVTLEARKLESRLKITDYELSKLSKQFPESLGDLSGLFSIESTVVALIYPEKIELSVKKLNSKIKNYKQTNQVFSIEHKLQQLLISELSIAIADNSPKTAKVKIIEFSGNELEADFNKVIFKNESQKVILKNLELTEEDVGIFNVISESLYVEITKFGGVKEKLSINSEGFKILANKVGYNQEDGLDINDIVVDGINAKLLLKNSVLKSANKSNMDTSSKPSNLASESTPSSKIKLKINNIEFANSRMLSFTDETISPTYSRDVIINSFNLNNVDSANPDKASQFSIKGQSDKYTKFQLHGFIKPFTDKVNLKLAGEIVEVSLPPANSYVEEVLGFQFETGELDISFDIEVQDSEIEGYTDVKIRGLNLASTGNYNQDNLKEQTALPLNVALGMLKDDDDNVELNIPMQGNIASPTFGFSSFISLITEKAIQSAAQSYLIKTFIPYAELLSVTISAGSYILKTRFEDLPYENQQIEISDQQKIYLQQFVELMKAKPDTRVKVCAIATIEEISEENFLIFDDSQKVNELQRFAKLRMEKFKEFVVLQQIESSRILLCSPKVDLTEKTIPRITISI